MTLVFIYGPPAVGKTTVGRELAGRTGYRFFYNHLTVPAAQALFPSSEPHHTPEYTTLLHTLRLDALEAAAKAGLNTIFTLAYSGAVDDPYIARMAAAFTSRGGRVCFVQLTAPDAVLLERVTDPGREALHMGKMTSPEHLRQVLDSRDVRAAVPYPGVLKIDTSTAGPRQAAQEIMERFRIDPAA